MTTTLFHAYGTLRGELGLAPAGPAAVTAGADDDADGGLSTQGPGDPGGGTSCFEHPPALFEVRSESLGNYAFHRRAPMLRKFPSRSPSLRNSGATVRVAPYCASHVTRLLDLWLRTGLARKPSKQVSNLRPLFSENLLNSPSALHAEAAQPVATTPETAPAALGRDVSVPPAATDPPTRAAAEPPQLSHFSVPCKSRSHRSSGSRWRG